MFSISFFAASASGVNKNQQYVVYVVALLVRTAESSLAAHLRALHRSGSKIAEIYTMETLILN